jgi:hypothetical protein
MGTVKQNGRVCAKCRTSFFNITKTCDSYDNPAADINEPQKIQHQENNSSYEPEDASVSIEITNSSLQATGESLFKTSQLQEKKCSKK